MKSEIGAVEASVRAFEAASSDGSNMEQGADLEASVAALEHGLGDILDSSSVCTSFSSFTAMMVTRYVNSAFDRTSGRYLPSTSRQLFRRRRA